MPDTALSTRAGRHAAQGNGSGHASGSGRLDGMSRPAADPARAQLLTGVWGDDHTGERTVVVHVRRLRVKLGVHHPLITTVYGVGYRLSDDARIAIFPQVYSADRLMWV